MTAEPRGAYHLEPLHDSLARMPCRFVHMVPYDEPLQGRPLAWTSSDPGVLVGASRLVVTGGALSGWTSLAVHRAAQLDVPVLFSELAFLPTSPRTYSPPSWPQLEAASCQSPASAIIVSAMFPGAPVFAVGSPQLDGVDLAGDPTGDVASRRVLLLSRPDRAVRDPSDQLLLLARLLMDGGFEVSVRCHPREDAGFWSGVDVDRSPDLVSAARECFAVAGYPGSALSLLAAAGAPCVALSPSESGASSLPEPPDHQMALVAARVGDARAAADAVRRRLRVPERVRRDLAGPTSGACSALARLWAFGPSHDELSALRVL